MGMVREGCEEGYIVNVMDLRAGLIEEHRDDEMV